MKKLGETLLISEELLKLYSPISKNVGVDRIFPFIHLAQPYYIVPILGKALTEELQYQIEEDALTEENKALILKIAMPLAMWTSYLAVRGLGYSFTQKGITKEKSENSESLNEKEMAEYMLSLKNQSEMARSFSFPTYAIAATFTHYGCHKLSATVTNIFQRMELQRGISRH